MAQYKYSLTFEFDLVAPVTSKGTVEANSLRTVVARAVDDSIEKNPNMKWRSVVVVIERKDD